ncbi:unnamed protein product [marine sediment metagenome]|uniref:Rubrerythrin diiron-binding domain-containing protein n=1 Tax=marine sediment metagenome TaxID=412755 RepID=X1E3N5_9ZZZZ
MSIFFSVREAVEMAISTERSGQAFYQTASKLAREKSLEELFRGLAEEEEKHLKIFQGFYDTLKERPETTPYNWEEAKLYLKALVDSRFFTGPDRAINLAREAKDSQEEPGLLLPPKKLFCFFSFLCPVLSENLPGS